MKVLGTVDAIGASGKVWVGHHASDIADMLFNELRLANKSIQITSFSTGHKSNTMEKFFSIIENQLRNRMMKINIIVNDDKKDRTITPYARKKLKSLQNKFPEQFFPQYFEQTRIKNTSKILHAKVTVIDGEIALIGSANLSKGALESNYEIMIKITGDAAVELSKMLTHLSEQIRLDSV